MGQSPRASMVKSVRHHDLVFLHDLHQIHHDLRHIDISHIRSTIFLHQIPGYPHRACCESGLPLNLTKSQNCILDLSDIVQWPPLPHAWLRSAHGHALREPSHHSHIDPDDLAALDPHIARMGIRMEKAILHHLLDEVVHKFRFRSHSGHSRSARRLALSLIANPSIYSITRTCGEVYSRYRIGALTKATPLFFLANSAMLAASVRKFISSWVTVHSSLKTMFRSTAYP